MASFRQLKEQREARHSTGISRAVAVSRNDSANNSSSTAAAPIQDTLHQIPATAIPSSQTSTPSAPSQEVSQSNSINDHLEENHDLQIRSVDGKGRGLFWAPKDERRVGRGTTLLRLQPELTILSSENLTILCHKCYSPAIAGKALQRCSGCKVLHYCSMQCQKADWPSHRRECSALQMFRKNANREGNKVTHEPGTTLRLLGRLIWEHKRLGEKWWKSIQNLQSNREAINSDESLMQLPLRLAFYLGASTDEDGRAKMTELGLPTAADVLDLISRATLNTIVAYSSDLSAVGVALSTTAAMINHSCMPNVAIVYPNGPGVKQPMHVVAIRDLNPGEELTTFYVDVADPYEQRQRLLQQRYSFTCRCRLCSRSKLNDKVDAREALWCGRKGCTGWVSSSLLQENVLCTNCKQPRTIELLEIESTIKEGVDTLNKVEKLINEGKWSAALSTAQATVKTLSKIQPPSAYPFLSLLRQLQTACIMCATTSDEQQEALKHFEEAIRLHFVSLAGMQASNGKIYSEGHPSRAIALATLATLLVREASPQEGEWAAAMASKSIYLHRVPAIPPIGPLRDQAGISVMMQAIKELRIAYGNDEEGGEPGRKLIEQVRQWKENESLSAMATTQRRT